LVFHLFCCIIVTGSFSSFTHIFFVSLSNYNPFIRQIFSFILYAAITVKTIFLKANVWGGKIHSFILFVVNILTAFLGVCNCGYVWLKRDFKNVKSFV